MNPRFNFMGPARFITLATLILAALAAGVVFTKGFNYSIDFTGGTAYTLRASPEVGVDTLRRFLETQGFPAKEAVITQVQSATADYKEFSVKLPPLPDAKNAWSWNASSARNSRPPSSPRRPWARPLAPSFAGTR